MDGKLVQSALDVMSCGDQEPVPSRTNSTGTSSSGRRETSPEFSAHVDVPPIQACPRAWGRPLGLAPSADVDPVAHGAPLVEVRGGDGHVVGSRSAACMSWAWHTGALES